MNVNREQKQRNAPITPHVRTLPDPTDASVTEAISQCGGTKFCLVSVSIEAFHITHTNTGPCRFCAEKLLPIKTKIQTAFDCNKTTGGISGGHLQDAG